MRFVRRLTLTMALLLVAACAEEQPWNLRDVSGLMPELEFELTRAADGETVTAETYEGQVTVLYFGFTHCPDICPLTLARFSQALEQMGDAAQGARVLFVSVDPKRDTRERLQRYVASFGEEFVGLRGEIPELRELTKRYSTTFGYGEPNEAGFYDVSHSSAAFIFDREGELRLLAREDADLDAIAADLQRLLDE